MVSSLFLATSTSPTTNTILWFVQSRNNPPSDLVPLPTPRPAYAMESVGRLTKSGKLYEGNCPEWAKRISALLEERYGGVEPDYSFRSPDTIDPRDIVLSEVSPTVRSRLPDLLPTQVQPDDFGGWPTLELGNLVAMIDLGSRWYQRINLG